MVNSRKAPISSCADLEEYLQKNATSKWKNLHNNRTLWEAYQEIKNNLKPIQENVTVGAMAEGFKEYCEKCRSDIEQIKKESQNVSQELYDYFSSEHIIFLNDHGPEHIKKVIDRASDLLQKTKLELDEFESFILLCAIQIHDIGNVFGRTGHEKKLRPIFDENSQNIILDTPEKRVIQIIAMAHGGKASDGSKNTISKLPEQEAILGTEIRTRFLAAILRFADELADDSSRANRSAMDLGIIGLDSILYHDYSTALHTVKVEKNQINNDYQIELIYEFETTMLSKKYAVASVEKFLLDEIYDRTLKMERERRYCMKFMKSAIDIERIIVSINIYDSHLNLFKSIRYTLEDINYPDSPHLGCIKDIDSNIPNGNEMLQVMKQNEGD